MITLNLTKQFFFVRTHFIAVNAEESVAKKCAWEITAYTVQNAGPTFVNNSNTWHVVISLRIIVY
jgi:hypothetical protein